jgi:hypothetical protein
MSNALQNRRIAYLRMAQYRIVMKTLTVRLPDVLAAEIESESRPRKLSKSDVARERLAPAGKPGQRQPALIDAIGDAIGSADRLPRDLSARTKRWGDAPPLPPSFLRRYECLDCASCFSRLS